MSKVDVFRLIILLALVFLIILELYTYVFLLILCYCGYKYVTSTVKQVIDARGRVVVITGCDTGFGHEAAIRLEKAGFTIVAGCLFEDGDGARKLKALDRERLHVVQLDVTDDDHVTQAVTYVQKHCSVSGDKMWAVINNAAINRLGDIEFVSVRIMKQVADVNLYGMIRVTKAFLPLLRQSQGRVVNVTSVRGRVALATDAIYTQTKWACEAFSDILRREMFRFGVKVIIIEPGNFGGVTGMLQKANIDRIVNASDSEWAATTPEVRAAYGDEYRDTCLRGLRECVPTSYRTMDPVLDGLEDAVTNSTPRYRHLIQGSNKLLDWYCVVGFLHSFLPEGLMDYLIRQIDPLPPVAQQVMT